MPERAFAAANRAVTINHVFDLSCNDRNHDNFFAYLTP
jgi:hypothetical protein